MAKRLFDLLFIIGNIFKRYCTCTAICK